MTRIKWPARKRRPPLGWPRQRRPPDRAGRLAEVERGSRPRPSGTTGGEERLRCRAEGLPVGRPESWP
eukprot:9497619-Lingulodinium_polyedra.AAC.1